jgi:putative heme transporter
VDEQSSVLPAAVATGRRRDTLRRWVRPKRVAAAVVVVIAVAIAAKVLSDSSDELLSAADSLTDLVWGWVVVALIAEIASYLARGAGQSLLLRQAPDAVPPGSRPPGAVVLGAGTLAGDAAAYCLPFGFAASGVVMFKVMRRRDVDQTVAGWMFGLSTLLYLTGIGVITVVAVEIAGDADPIPGLQEAAIVLVLGLVGIGVLYLFLHRGPLVGAVRAWRLRRRRASARASLEARRAGTAGTRRWPARVVASVRANVRGHLDVLRRIRVPWPLLAAAFALMLLSWATDIAVLGLAYASVGATPPWLGLLLAYCAGQVASAAPVTPGGLGVVEGSLTLALVAFGSATTVSLAAVLLYRLITYWMCIPLGGLAWVGLRATAARSRRSSSALAEATS